MPETSKRRRCLSFLAQLGARLKLDAILEDDADGAGIPGRIGTVKPGSDGGPLRLRRSYGRSCGRVVSVPKRATPGVVVSNRVRD